MMGSTKVPQADLGVVVGLVICAGLPRTRNRDIEVSLLASGKNCMLAVDQLQRQTTHSQPAIHGSGACALR